MIIEVDEGQHRSYKSCGNTREERMATENRRMFGIFQSLFHGIPVIFIRYNPDTFRDENNILQKIPETKRQAIFLSWVKRCIRNEDGCEGCVAKYLFYNGWKESDVLYSQITDEMVLN